MYQQTHFFHAEKNPTIILLRNIRKLTEGTFLGQDDMKKHLVGKSQKAYRFTLTDIFPQQHIGEHTCGHAGYMWKPGHSLDQEPSQAILKQYIGSLNTSS